MSRVLALALLAACTATPSPAPHAWTVENGFLRDSEGRAVVMRGVNLAGDHKWAPYFSFHQPADFQRIRAEWGMNAIRLVVVWAALEPQKGTFDAAYLDAVAERVHWARDAGLLVVLDMHQDLYGEGFAGGDGAPKWTCDQAHYDAYVPTEPWFLNYVNEHVLACVDGFWADEALQAEFAAAWKRLAARLRGESAIVGFEPLNEPFWGSASPDTFEADTLAPFYEKVVAAVRAEQPEWVAFLEPFSGRNLGFSTHLPRPSFDRVVYAPHAYDASAESGNGFDPGHREAFMANIAALKKEADALGAALWIGEYGGMSDRPGIADYMDAAYDGAGAAAASTMYWDFGRNETYGMLHADGSDKPGLLDVLVRPYPMRVAGTPVSYGFDDGAFTFTFRPAPGTTEISVPKRAYPGGYAVECGGCAFEQGDAVLRISRISGDPATVTLRPQ